MKPNKQTYQAAVGFAKSSGFDGATYAAEYKGGIAYHANSNALDGAKSGYPHFVIVNDEDTCRFSTPDEAFEIMDKTTEL